MGDTVYATLGRAPDNDVVIDDPTVSNHHARLSWVGAALVVEDLSSANGTFVDGKRIRRSRTRPGADVRLGAVPVPWSHEGLRRLLKAGAGARTLAMPEAGLMAYVCGKCGHMGALPEGRTPKKMTCASCGATLGVRTARASGGSGFAWAVVALMVVAATAAGYMWTQPWVTAPALVTRVEEGFQSLEAEQRIGGATAERIAKALTPMDALTRNTAVKIAARSDGPFHVEQVAEVWGAVRKQWRYVNDPEGREYFATARETIENGYVGDCDDFAITLVSMITAIGGKARVVLMDGPRGGHAYAEACVHGEPTVVAKTLGRHYRNAWKKYLGGKAPATMAYRSDPTCPIWLNLDWNSSVPGGAYEPEAWAVAIYEGGKSEVLTPAPAAPETPPKP